MFAGFSRAPELAGYAFEVLYRQVKRARADHVKTALKRCGPLNKTRRADIFCEAWVISASDKVAALAMTSDRKAAIAGYLEQRYSLSSFQGRNRSVGRTLSNRDMGDWSAGRRQGHAAELNRGVGGQSAPLALK